MFEFIFEFIIEGISEVTKNLKMHHGLKIIMSTIAILTFSVFFIWLMIKFGVWE